MLRPLVSVAMITYNHESYIRKAIECVLAQKTDFPFELVIGEDFSTDGTREIVLDYAARYGDKIRLVTSESNVGMHKNCYRTEQACEGKYIAYCEGDDYWQRDDKLQLQTDYMEKHPDCGLVFSDYNWYFTQSGRLIEGFLKFYDSNILHSPRIEDIVAKRVDIRTCTVMARRNLVEQIKKADPLLHFNGHFRMADIQVWAEISLVSEIHYIDESLATYQILEESATQSRLRLSGLHFSISDSEMYLYLCNKYKLSPDLRSRYENIWRRSTLQLAFFEKNRELAEAARKHYPDLSLKDWIWYLGTRYTLFRPVVIVFRHLQKHTVEKGLEAYVFRK